MGTETKFQSAPTLNANLLNLPMMSKYSQNQLVTKVDTFRKGEKNFWWFLQLIAFGAIAFGAYKALVYILPKLLETVSEILCYAVIGASIVFLFMAAPAISAWMRVLARAIHKRAIAYDPWKQLMITKDKMIANQSTFRVAKANLKMMEQDMSNEKVRSNDEVTKGEKELIRLKLKAEGIRDAMKKMEAEMGVNEAKGEDTYVDMYADLQKTLSIATQISNKVNQSRDFTLKFGARQTTLKKVNQKLVMVETSMEIEISNFDAMVDMLKKDFSVGQKLNAATSAAVSVLGITEDWQKDYALEVINLTISADMAQSAGNFRDIESLTQNYDLNSDELFANLESVVDKIDAGENKIDINKFNNPDYKLTSVEKAKSGFPDLF